MTAAVAWIGVLVPGAGAQQQQQPPPTLPADPSGVQQQPGTVVQSWAMTPTGTNPNEPSSRVYFTYDLAPGSEVKDSVTLWNYSNVQLTFQIYTTDAFNNPDGAFELLAGSKKPKDVGTWITLPQANVTARPRSKIDIPFTVKVPAGARPGDHAGAILAANQAEGTGPDGKVVLLDRRTGSRMYLRVSGPLRPALVVENLHTVYHGAVNPLGGSMDVTYTVRNVGNVRLAARQRVSAAGAFGLGKTERRVKDLPELLPNNAITLHQRFTDIPATLRAGAEVHLEPGEPGDKGAHVPAVNRDGHTWAIPWSIVVLALLIWLVRKTYLPIRERRRVLAQRGQDPPPGPAPGDLTTVR